MVGKKINLVSLSVEEVVILLTEDILAAPNVVTFALLENAVNHVDLGSEDIGTVVDIGIVANLDSLND